MDENNICFGLPAPRPNKLDQTLQTKLGSCGSDLALAVGLDDATRHQHVSLGCNGIVEDVVELAHLCIQGV